MKFFGAGYDKNACKSFDLMSVRELEEALRWLDHAVYIKDATPHQAQEQLEIMLLARSMGL